MTSLTTSFRRPLCSFVLAAIAGVAGMTASTDDAAACGGCFHQEDAPENESSVVTSHRMAVSISTEQTVLWDQVQYTGNPADFAWVLPVKPGATIELGNNALFETLEVATQAMVQSPPLSCGGGGGFDDGWDGGGEDFDEGNLDSDFDAQYGSGCCGGPATAFGADSGDGSGGGWGTGSGGSASGAGNAGNFGTGGGGEPIEEDPVQVVEEQSVGPYESVTLSTDEPGVLQEWLADHGYAVGEEMGPVIDAFVAEGFDFIALRLAPGEGVNQMQPVRVISPGASPTLPLRMVAAGTGAEVGLTLFVISEGRWATENFDNGEIAPSDITWDFLDSSSNYAALRDDLLAQDGGGTWVTTYAKQGALLSPLPDPFGGTLTYAVGTDVSSSIAGAYYLQGAQQSDTPIDPYECMARAEGYASSMDKVVPTCDRIGPGGTGGAGGMGSGGMGGGGTGGAGGGEGGAGGIGTGTGGFGGEPGEGEDDCLRPGDGEVGADAFACEELDDLSTALLGLHLSDTWLVRLDAELPRTRLGTDLALAPHAEQAEVEHHIIAGQGQNPPANCDVVSVTSGTTAKLDLPPQKSRRSGSNGQLYGLLGLVTVGALALGRRRWRNLR